MFIIEVSFMEGHCEWVKENVFNNSHIGVNTQCKSTVLQSKRALENREYMEARSKAQWALWLNMAAVISYLMMMIFFIGLIVAVIFSVT